MYTLSVTLLNICLLSSYIGIATMHFALFWGTFTLTLLYSEGHIPCRWAMFDGPGPLLADTRSEAPHQHEPKLNRNETQFSHAKYYSVYVNIPFLSIKKCYCWINQT